MNGLYSVALCQGHRCRVRGSLGCALLLTWIDSDHETIRVVTGYVGENGIKPDVWYRLNDAHEFEEVK